VLKRNDRNAAVESAPHCEPALPQVEVDASGLRPTASPHLDAFLMIQILQHPRPLSLIAATLKKLSANKLAEHNSFCANDALHIPGHAAGGVAVDCYP